MGLRVAAGIVLLLATQCAAAHRGLRQEVAPSIVGGQSAVKGRFQYQVGITKDPVKRARVFTCGGSLIRDDVVLTASHCEIKANRKFTVFAGAYTPPPNNDGVAYTIKRVVDHPNWLSSGQGQNFLQWDLTLIFLTKCVTTAGPNGARVAKLATYDDVNAAGAGLTFYFSGFGTTSSGADDGGQNGDTPPTLQYGVGMLPPAGCPDLQKFDAPTSGFCVQGSSSVDGGRVPLQDSCQGDSGGPNMINVVSPANAVLGDANGSGDRIVGITSYGAGCGQIGLPGYYTSVPFFHDYIQAHIDAAKKPCGNPSFNYTQVSNATNPTNWGGVKPNQSIKLKAGQGVADCATRCKNLKKGCAAFGLSLQKTAKATLVFCDIYWVVLPNRLCDSSLDSRLVPCGRRSGSQGAFRAIWT